MKKQILIDSLYINNSGGLRLLDYLVRTLECKKIDFFLLADARTRGKFDTIRHVEYMDASLRNRGAFYKLHAKDFSNVLCFGNVPPPINLEVPVYTYFHNVNRLDVKVNYSFKKKVLSWMKRSYMKSLRVNTDKWIVQTSYTKQELIKYFEESEDRVLIMPFYELPEDTGCKDIERNDYCFIGAYTGNKGHDELLAAWKILHERGENLVLHLTVDKSNRLFSELEKRYDFNELNIINHGFVPFSKVMDIYHKSKAIIYPSKNESLGLGLIEAIHYGCDVLSSDLPYTYSVCKPSGVFDPTSPESIADAVGIYEYNNRKKSTLLIHNMIDDLIKLITKS